MDQYDVSADESIFLTDQNIQVQQSHSTTSNQQNSIQQKINPNKKKQPLKNSGFAVPLPKRPNNPISEQTNMSEISQPIQPYLNQPLSIYLSFQTITNQSNSKTKQGILTIDNISQQMKNALQPLDNTHKILSVSDINVETQQLYKCIQGRRQLFKGNFQLLIQDFMNLNARMNEYRITLRLKVKDFVFQFFTNEQIRAITFDMEYEYRGGQLIVLAWLDQQKQEALKSLSFNQFTPDPLITSGKRKQKLASSDQTKKKLKKNEIIANLGTEENEHNNQSENQQQENNEDKEFQIHVDDTFYIEDNENEDDEDDEENV